jgi:hypothetical protein
MLETSSLSEENGGRPSYKSLENGTSVIDMTPGDKQEIAALSKITE